MTRAQEPITKNDIALIHTEGLDEEIRCAMCTNPIANDRGCNGSCTVNDKMYKKVMGTIENHIISRPTTTVSLEVYKQVAWERDIAIEQLHELGYEFGEKINCDTCVYLKETDGSNCYECIKGMKNNYEPTTKNDLGVDKTFYEQIVEYCNEHFLVLVEKDVWEDAEKALTTKNDLGVDCISREQALNEFCIYNPYDSIGVDKVRSYLKALPPVTPQEPRIDFEELKRKILMEVDGGTDEAWLAYGEVCIRISNSIDEFVSDMRGKEE